MRKACKGIQVVHHLAYINGTEYFYTMPETVLEIAVKGMMNIIDACKENNIHEMYVASSSETYQTPKVFPTKETERLVVPDPLNPRFSLPRVFVELVVSLTIICSSDFKL